MSTEITDAMIYAFAGEPEITATDAHAIRVGLVAAFAAAEPKHCEGLDPGDWPEADCGNHAPHPSHDRTALTDVQQDLAHVESQLRDAERDRLKALAERDNLRELWAALAAEVNRLSADLASARAERDEEQEKRDESIESYQLAINELYATQQLVDQKQEELGRYSDLLTAARAKAEQDERDRIQLQNENTELLAKLDRQRVNADLARRDLARVSDWHTLSTHDDERGTCGGCSGQWPCDTRQILDGYLNPAYVTARCGQRAVHAPHISETGPDRPRNCPGVPVPPVGHTAGCVAGLVREPYCEAKP